MAAAVIVVAIIPLAGAALMFWLSALWAARERPAALFYAALGIVLVITAGLAMAST